MKVFYLLIIFCCFLSASHKSVKAETLLQVKNDLAEEYIDVNKVKIEGQSIFINELSLILNGYQNRHISIKELSTLVEEITNFYASKGYESSGAYLPVNYYEPSTQTLTVGVLEGYLADIKISGNKKLSEKYIENQIKLSSPLNFNQLLEQLQLLRSNGLIESVEAELIPDVTPGANILDLKIKEADTISLNLQSDNNNSPGVGSFRRGLSFQNNNLLGFGDRFRLDYFNSQGSDSISGLYSIPIGKGSFSIATGYANNEIIEEPFNDLEIELESFTTQFSLEQPLIASTTQELTIGTSLSYQKSKSFVLGESFGISRGADENGNLSVTTLSFFQKYNQRSSTSLFAINSQFNFGLDAFGSTQNPEGIPDSSFFSWNGEAAYLKQFAPNTLWFNRLNLQFAPSELLSSQQFRLGGVDSIRGYRKDVALSDNGLSFSTEVQVPVYSWGNNSVIQIVPFFDAGWVWNSDEVELSENFLAGLGVGLQLNLSDRIYARLDYGIPLVDLSSEGDSWQEQGLYFKLNTKF